jgi:hypothetical protein
MAGLSSDRSRCNAAANLAARGPAPRYDAWMYQRLIVLLAVVVTGCAHRPETVVRVSAPSPEAWTVRNVKGTRLCTLPCRVELDAHDTVVVARDGGRQFMLNQENLGTGAFEATVRTREEPSESAEAVRAFSSALVDAGGVLIDRRREAAGIALSGLGTAGILIASAMRRHRVEELWVTKMSAKPE